MKLSLRAAPEIPNSKTVVGALNWKGDSFSSAVETVIAKI